MKSGLGSRLRFTKFGSEVNLLWFVPLLLLVWVGVKTNIKKSLELILNGF